MSCRKGSLPVNVGLVGEEAVELAEVGSGGEVGERHCEVCVYVMVWWIKTMKEEAREDGVDTVCSVAPSRCGSAQANKVRQRLSALSRRRKKGERSAKKKVESNAEKKNGARICRKAQKKPRRCAALKECLPGGGLCSCRRVSIQKSHPGLPQRVQFATGPPCWKSLILLQFRKRRGPITVRGTCENGLRAHVYDQDLTLTLLSPEFRSRLDAEKGRQGRASCSSA